MLIHQANIEGSMGAGIAHSIAEKYPGAALENKRAHKWGIRLGEFSSYRLEKSKFIINLYAQSIRQKSSAGIPTDYNAVVLGLQNVRRWLASMGENWIIGVPYNMGCALGGGNWDVYSSIIDSTIGQAYPVIAVELV